VRLQPKDRGKDRQAVLDLREKAWILQVAEQSLHTGLLSPKNILCRLIGRVMEAAVAMNPRAMLEEGINATAELLLQILALGNKALIAARVLQVQA
jgi:hypothetical protein